VDEHIGPGEHVADLARRPGAEELDRSPRPRSATAKRVGSSWSPSPMIRYSTSTPRSTRSRSAMSACSWPFFQCRRPMLRTRSGRSGVPTASSSRDGRLEPRHVDRVGDDAVRALRRAAALLRPRPDRLGDGVDDVGGLPDLVVAGGVVEAERVEVVAAEARHRPAARRSADVGAPVGERAVAEVDDVRAQLDHALLEVLARDVQAALVADLRAQLGEEAPVLVVGALADHVHVPAPGAGGRGTCGRRTSRRPSGSGR
jgi:hypothetical protein